jgi:DNA ligase-associated metallophosphoesterase
MYSFEYKAVSGYLFPEKAVYLKEYQTLLIADAHLGKAVSFRRLGVPVPRGTTQSNLQTISRLIAQTGATRVVFLGDLFHSQAALQSAVLTQWHAWRQAHASVAIVLVEGNHDAKAFRAKVSPLELGITLVEEPWFIDTERRMLALCHFPQTVPGAYAITGHIHPSFNLYGRAGESARLPCFWFGEQCAVLPAFGEFTGSHVVLPEPGDRVYVIADDSVLPVPRG